MSQLHSSCASVEAACCVWDNLRFDIILRVEQQILNSVHSPQLAELQVLGLGVG